MKNQNVTKNLTMLLIVLLAAALTLSMVPAPVVYAEGMTTTSDLAVKILSSPKAIRACQTFKARLSVTNLGPDPASHLYVTTWLPDQLELISLTGAPESLAVGQTVKFTAIIKVVAFVPGESREAWVGTYALSDPYPDISIDPNPDNDWISKPLKLKGNPVASCP